MVPSEADRVLHAYAIRYDWELYLRQDICEAIRLVMTPTSNLHHGIMEKTSMRMKFVGNRGTGKGNKIFHV